MNTLHCLKGRGLQCLPKTGGAEASVRHRMALQARSNSGRVPRTLLDSEVDSKEYGVRRVSKLCSHVPETHMPLARHVGFVLLRVEIRSTSRHGRLLSVRDGREVAVRGSPSTSASGLSSSGDAAGFSLRATATRCAWPVRPRARPASTEKTIAGEYPWTRAHSLAVTPCRSSHARASSVVRKVSADIDIDLLTSYNLCRLRRLVVLW